MPIPFILGLVIGGSAVIAYNKRKEISTFFKTENTESLLCKSKEMANNVKDTLIATKETICEKKEEMQKARKENSSQKDKQCC